MSKQDELVQKYENEIADEVLYSEEDESAEVRKRPINWDSYTDAFVTKSELAKIMEYDRPNVDKLEKFIQNGVVLSKIFMVYLARLNKDEDVRYVLTLVDDLFVAAQNSKNPDANLQTVLAHFHKLEKAKIDASIPPLPFGPILTLLNRKKEDAYIISKASRILTTFILKFPNVTLETVDNAFRWFVELLTKPSGKHVERKISIGLIGLRPLLAVNDFRALFVDDSIDGLTPLTQLATFEDRREDDIVVDQNISKRKKRGVKEEINNNKETVERKGPNFQQIYEAVYCLWSLSFNSQAQQKMTDKKLIYNLCHIVKRCNKIKVIRISLATLRNLLGLGKNNESMITFGLLQALGLLKQKRWGDEELETDIKEIEQALEKNVDDLTSWDRYKVELESNKLEWSPPHKSNKFWQENFLKFEEEDFLCLRILKSILQDPRQDTKVLAIACWDVGEFVRVHPGGKRICQMLELKVPIMEMLKTAESKMGDEDSQKLAKEALTALQKMMITNWEYLQ